jgi:hypothetical protein
VEAPDPVPGDGPRRRDGTDRPLNLERDHDARADHRAAVKADDPRERGLVAGQHETDEGIGIVKDVGDAHVGHDPTILLDRVKGPGGPSIVLPAVNEASAAGSWA